MSEEKTLAERLGQTVHVSALRKKVTRLRERYPISDSKTIEDWLLDVANSRGAKSVSRVTEHQRPASRSPDQSEFSNAELIVTICQPHNRDRPQWLRAAAEIISKGDLELKELLHKARMERADRVLAELARQALIAEPEHEIWQQIREAFHRAKPLSDSLIHWTRLTTKKAEKQNRFSRSPHRPLAK